MTDEIEEIKSAVNRVFDAFKDGEPLDAVLDSPAYSKERMILGIEEEEKMKRMPLLILGKRQSGKTTALLNFAKKAKTMIIVPTLTEKNFYTEQGIKNVESWDKTKNYYGKMEVVIDEFIRYVNIHQFIPKNVTILALTGEINDFFSIINILRNSGYNIYDETFEEECRSIQEEEK